MSPPKVYFEEYVAKLYLQKYMPHDVSHLPMMRPPRVYLKRYSEHNAFLEIYYIICFRNMLHNVHIFKKYIR